MTDFQNYLLDELKKTLSRFDKSFQAEVGQKIKYLRNENKVTQKELAELTGIPQGKISQIENGQINLTLKTVELIFDALGYHVQIKEEKYDR